jgi:hypothetical protein
VSLQGDSDTEEPTLSGAPALADRLRGWRQRSRAFLDETPGEPWWRRHLGRTVTIAATVVTGYAVWISRVYSNAAGLPANAWHVDPATFAAHLAYLAGAAVALTAGIPMAARWTLDRLEGVAGPTTRTWVRRAGWTTAGAGFVWLTWTAPNQSTTANVVSYGVYGGVVLVAAAAGGRWPRIIGHAFVVVAVGVLALAMLVSADNAGHDHARGIAGGSGFSDMFVSPEAGLVDGRCVLRIGQQIYIDVDGTSSDNVTDGDVLMDASGPFTLGCP